ncbi:MAG: DUF721 domain-containing protein [Alphaproteobacteria bacterium]|nr:DUF721 domain-containing protein [Alphaproteobacteria bacterium]
MSNQKNKDFTKRAARPQTIAGALGGLLKLFGVRASDSDLVARWPEIIGPEISNLADICAVKKLRDGTYNIVLRPRNPAYTLKLSYMTDEIKKQINKYFGADCVGKISFRK